MAVDVRHQQRAAVAREDRRPFQARARCQHFRRDAIHRDAHDVAAVPASATAIATAAPIVCIGSAGGALKVGLGEGSEV